MKTYYFKDWESALGSASLDTGVRDSYRITINWYLGYLKRRHELATIENARGTTDAHGCTRINNVGGVSVARASAACQETAPYRGTRDAYRTLAAKRRRIGKAGSGVLDIGFCGLLGFCAILRL